MKREREREGGGEGERESEKERERETDRERERERVRGREREPLVGRAASVLVRWSGVDQSPRGDWMALRALPCHALGGAGRQEPNRQQPQKQDQLQSMIKGQMNSVVARQSYLTSRGYFPCIIFILPRKRNHADTIQHCCSNNQFLLFSCSVATGDHQWSKVIDVPHPSQDDRLSTLL